jgi:hypothetical protein
MKIVTQIIKEFWLPLVLSILWVLYNIFSSEGSAEWDVKKVVNIGSSRVSVERVS